MNAWFLTFLSLMSIVVLTTIFVWSAERTVSAVIHEEFNFGALVFCLWIGVLIGCFLSCVHNGFVALGY